MSMRLGLGSGITRFRRLGAFVAQLNNLFLTASTVPETAASGTTVGALTNTQPGSTYSLIDSATGRFALVGTNINTAALTDISIDTVYNITVRESNAGFTPNFRDSIISITVTAVAGSSPITAPVLAFAAARVAGATIDLAGADSNANITVDATVAAGMYWEIQVASNNTFTAPLSGDVAIRSETLQIVGDDFVSTIGPQFASMATLPNGATYIRLRVSDDSGRVSAWSNILFDTIAVATLTKFVATNGASKNTFATVSTNGLAVSGASDANDAGGVRTDRQPAADRTQFEYTITSLSLNCDILVHIDNGVVALGPTTPNVSAVGTECLRIAMFEPFDYAIRNGDGDVFFFSGTGPVVGDVITVEITKSTGLIKIWSTRGGTTTLQATKTRLFTNYFVSCHPKKTGVLTFNFGETAFVKALDPGVVAYNG